MGVLEDEISLSVQTQSLAGQEASKQVRSAQTHISALFLKMADIGRKAAHSEKMVRRAILLVVFRGTVLICA